MGTILYLSLYYLYAISCTCEFSTTRIKLINGLVSQCQPPEFQGTIDPIVVDAWIHIMEGMMEIFPMIDQEKIRYASFLFKGDARVWWDLIRETQDVSSMTSAEFKRVFDIECRTENMWWWSYRSLLVYSRELGALRNILHDLTP